MKKELTKEQLEEIKNLSAMADDDIDYSDIPPVRTWEGAEVGKFYRPMKKSVTIRLDADILSWLKKDGRGYQSRINKLLRSAMEHQVEQQHRAENH